MAAKSTARTSYALEHYIPFSCASVSDWRVHPLLLSGQKVPHPPLSQYICCYDLTTLMGTGWVITEKRYLMGWLTFAVTFVAMLCLR